MSCCGGGGGGQNSHLACCNGGQPVRDTCNYFYSLVGDPCYQGLCCNDRPKIAYKPFMPSYERVRQRVCYSEKNVWHVWKVFGNNIKSSDCCRP